MMASYLKKSIGYVMCTLAEFTEAFYLMSVVFFKIKLYKFLEFFFAIVVYACY